MLLGYQPILSVILYFELKIFKIVSIEKLKYIELDYRLNLMCYTLVKGI
jgi:hypothetical protein